MTSKSALDLFHPVIAGWFRAEYGEASPPQQKGWPVIAAGDHTLILSPTGSGKTLAAFLWCINDLYQLSLLEPAKTFQKNPSGIHTLYISPLKALNNDIHRNLQQPLKGIYRRAEGEGYPRQEIRVLIRTGDTPGSVRQAMLRQPPHILITTPESLYLLLTSPRSREMFRHVRYIIVDEIHALSNNKRGVHLSLTLERLMAITEIEPVRIGLSATQRPLRRIADFLGGQKFDLRTQKFTPRAVTIADCSHAKKWMIQVLSPVDDFSDLPQPSVWPSVIQTLYDLIRQHKTTLIFVNMRAQTEKVARQLNELHHQYTNDPQAELVFPHHGSMSREMRFEIESRLKKGTLAAVVATASLELGIDIGSIDLVVQLEAPKSISASLQRIGRSGHMLDQASRGVIIPLYPADLDDAAALSSCLVQGDIEETNIPENCLDILAQQITAEVANHNLHRLDLYNQFRQSYCYRHLTLSVWDNVLEMLAGKYAHKQLPNLQPRLTWDRINDQLIARPGARLAAILNGGTIPDRGYYAVMLADSNVRLGEMEEEFVFESRVGDIFYLGNNEWRIENIQNDRIVVTPVKSNRPRPPFWKGEIPSRAYETSLKVGAFRQWLLENLDHPELENQLRGDYHLDSKSCTSLIKYIKRQKAQTGMLPTNRQIVVEWFQDEANDLNVVIHTSFGGRVNACWALALVASLEKKYHIEIQWSYNDDGILIRLLDTVDLPELEPLFKIPALEIDQLVKNTLTDSSLFAIQFRYNAGRALLLERSRPGKRIPLWLQRLRAGDLLQVLKESQDFPIILETYRSCLEDIFDLPTLLQIIKKLLAQEIQVHIIRTPYPSAMASGLLFNFLSSQMYERDRARLTADVSMVSSDLLTEILNSENIPSLVSTQIIESAYKHWQHLTESKKAGSTEDLFLLIEKLGPIETEELQQRAEDEIKEWMQSLQDQGRIIHINAPDSGWIVKSDHYLYTQPWNTEKWRIRIQKYLSTNGPLTGLEISTHLHLDLQQVEDILKLMQQDRDVVHGKLIKDDRTDYWCDRNNFTYLYRQVVTSRRSASLAVSRRHHYEFLLHWHNFARTKLTPSDLMDQYQGMFFPLHFFEREILLSRLADQSAMSFNSQLQTMHQLFTSGDTVVHVAAASTERIQLIFIPRGQGNQFSDYPYFNSSTADDRQPKAKMEQNLLAESEKPIHYIYKFLKENGASYFSDIESSSGLAVRQIVLVLQDLIKRSLVSCDDYNTFLTVLTFDSDSELVEKAGGSNKPFAYNPRSKISGRREIQQRVKANIQLKSGRWFLTSSFAVSGKILSVEEKVERQARLLLNRHGILIKEWYRLENGLVPWYQIFQMLKKLEWQGEIVRGYFIEGLSGIQYALPQAITLLERIVAHEQVPPPPTLISTLDPAVPFGRNIDWDLFDQHKNKVTITRSPGNHLFFVNGKAVMYLENYAARLLCLDEFTPLALPPLIQQLKIRLLLPAALRPRRRLEIENINFIPAGESEWAAEFIKLGFEQDDKKLILWPSQAT